MKKYFYQLSNGMLNFLFPVECIFCGSEEDWLCARCIAEAPRRNTLPCFGCGKTTTDGRWCGDCGKGKALLGVHAAAAYSAPSLREAIHAFKYKSVSVLARPLATFFIQFFEQWPFLFSARTLYIPVPLHERRFRHRGYNQSHLLVAHVLEKRGEGVCGCWLIARTHYRKPQVDCTAEERLHNVADVFYARRFPHISWPRVVLVDDVATTGATLEECARALCIAGAHDLWGLVLARG